ncbi:MarR family transcriptional regulator [Pseudoxanthobacter sp.]|uniref:MarR family winged helix-turn-helix transcriptional regulator n=1 Tax=Pseudoxanthobacter sp. TaxID=1925742 RepID=UPI002FE333D4
MPGGAEPAGEPHYDVIELLFFAYRAFIGRPDRILSEYGFGRAHHRVLHFVARNPGIRVTDLLDILKITKQSLGRVLKQLIDTGFIDQRPGPADRRQRLLYATDTGQALDHRLSMLQSRQIETALEGLGDDGHALAVRFLTGLAATESREAGPAFDADEEQP